MSPDTVESRVAALRQQVDDLAQTVRALAPLVAEHAGMRATVEHIARDLTEMEHHLAGIERAFTETVKQQDRTFREAIDALHKRMDLDALERAAGQQSRHAEQERNATQLRVAMIALLGTLLVAASTFLAVVVG